LLAAFIGPTRRPLPLGYDIRVFGFGKRNFLIAKLLRNQMLGTYQSINQYYYFRYVFVDCLRGKRSDQIRWPSSRPLMKTRQMAWVEGCGCLHITLSSDRCVGWWRWWPSALISSHASNQRKHTTQDQHVDLVLSTSTCWSCVVCFLIQSRRVMTV